MNVGNINGDSENVISSNGVVITVSIDKIYPAGVVESYATESDVWSPEDVETADMVKTVDGKTYKWGKNFVYSGTLTLAPNSKIRAMFNSYLLSLQRNGDSVTPPASVTMTIKHLNSKRETVYSDGVLISGAVDEQVGSERLADRSYKFKFGTMTKKEAI